MKTALTCGATAAVIAATAFVFDVPVNLQPTSPGTTQVGHLHISGTAITGGVQGYSPDTTGIAYGGDFRSVSTQGRGVLGNASATSGATYGGLFQAASTGGRGIAGIASATVGTTYGGFFTNFSTMGRGVYGEAKATSGVNYGVYGKVASPAGFAGFFEGNLASTGVISGNGSGLTNLAASALAGTIADARLSSNVAMRNAGNIFSDLNYFSAGNVFVGPRNTHVGLGEIFALSSAAVDWAGTYTTTPSGGMPYYSLDNVDHRAYHYLASNGTVRFDVGLSSPFALAPSGFVGFNVPDPQYPVDVRTNREDVRGTIHVMNGGTPVFNQSRIAISGVSVGASAANFVAGGLFYSNATGSGDASYAVQGVAEGTASTFGIYGSASGGTANYAGYFSGLLFASSSSAGVKAFTIDHPLDPANKLLSHSSVESDQRMNVYRGVVTTDASGRATIKLPNWFSALNTDIQYQLTVVDTTDSDEFILAKIVKKFDGTSFTLRTSQPNVEVNWQVSGRRHDPTSEYMPLEVESDKAPNMRGKYLIPEAYGKDPSLGFARPMTMAPKEIEAEAKRQAQVKKPAMMPRGKR